MHNEGLCTLEFIKRVLSVMRQENDSFEIILVDDGSQDNTLDILIDEAKKKKKLTIVSLARNSGQWAALYAGIQHSNGKYVVIMDSDLQHLPEEIPLLTTKIQEGFELVSGARNKRKESLFLRRIPSLIANALLRKITNCPSKDMGGFKCIEGNLARKLQLSAGQHRFLPALVWLQGGRVADVPISAPERFAGESHYGFARVFDVLFDIILFWFQNSFKSRPIYLFGHLSLITFLISSLMTGWTLYQKVFFHIDMGNRPLFFLGLGGFLAALYLISFGFILEILVNTKAAIMQSKPYLVRKVYGSSFENQLTK